MLGGGGHHAYPDHGGAPSPVNDMAIGVHHLRRRGIRRVLVLDLDAHFGNGTAASFPNDPDLFLFDFHGHASDFWHPDTLHLFKNFRDEPDARLYLQALQKELPNVLGEFRPEACLYAAGMDVFSGTPNPPLRLRVPDIEKREAFVFEALSSRPVPVAYVHAGGYASLETLAALHLITARAAHRALSK
jgi:acetoin utilization deacetylase AcuC-like enzyme